MAKNIPTIDELLEKAKSLYEETFDSQPIIKCFAPGRVNLIGEHIDYNDGFVLPMALSMVTVIVGNKNGTESTADIYTYSSEIDEPNRIQFDTKNLKNDEKPKWAKYIKGVIHSFGHSVPGFNAVIMCSVPVGSGLSSSAALEVSTLTFLESLTQKYIESPVNKALICQKAENDFVGMPCGIMDQLISVAGKKFNALLIDCRSLETFQIPFESTELVVLICNSNVRHELSSSEYSSRRQQCTKALEIMGLQSYRDATENHLSVLKNDEILMKRARHVITEIKRTYEAAEALRKHDFKKMGELMTKSHISLRDDFQVSCNELDILVDSAIVCNGVLGSRMTGGGFGGCTVTLLQKESVDNVISKIQENYKKRCGKQADFYISTPSDGTQIVQ